MYPREIVLKYYTLKFGRRRVSAAECFDMACASPRGIFAFIT